MKILNIVTQRAGIIENIESFVILDETDSITEKEIVRQAEQYFENWCIRNGWAEEYDEDEEPTQTMEELITNGWWENSNYDNISLVWSNVNL